MTPSPWIVRWSHLLSPGSRVLDIACGSGRHVRWFSERHMQVTALDRDAAALAALEPVARTVVADIEAGPWPLANERFDAVVVTNYLWRPLMPTVLASVDSGGYLIYETFAHGQASVGRPARAEFLLQPGELLRSLPADFRVLGYEDVFLEEPARFVQRITAVREAIPAANLATPPRYRAPA